MAQVFSAGFVLEFVFVGCGLWLDVFCSLIAIYTFSFGAQQCKIANPDVGADGAGQVCGVSHTAVAHCHNISHSGSICNNASRTTVARCNRTQIAVAHSTIHLAQR